MNYFSINGYWKNDKKEFEDFIVTNFDDYDNESEFDDGQIFYYGLSEKDLQEAVELEEDTMYEFVITSYERI